ncbi:MAG: hypothetical protein JWL73_423 [Actinomycetia bacterium]|nr:hypothetical protein [Actinomycetes bacterium]
MAKFRSDASTMFPTALPAPAARGRLLTLDLGVAYELDSTGEEHVRAVREQVRTGHYAPSVDDVAERIVAWLVPAPNHTM